MQEINYGPNEKLTATWDDKGDHLRNFDGQLDGFEFAHQPGYVLINLCGENQQVVGQIVLTATDALQFAQGLAESAAKALIPVEISK